MGRFETEMPTQPENLAALTDLPGRWIDAAHDRQPPKSITLDMDSSESPAHGDQEGAVWNGHFQKKFLHTLFAFNQFGDLERCALRPGNLHGADGWEDVLKPVPARYSAKARPSITRRRFRADAAFAIPTLFALLGAEGWDCALRIEGAPKLRLKAKAVRLQLHAPACNLANFMRTPATPKDIETWSLTSLRERRIKTGARLVRPGRHVILQMAAAALPRSSFAGVLKLINGLRAPPDGAISA